jgi:glycosyltransferase involved in cell wall biosynthesis
MADKPRLMYVVTEDWYFVSHRLKLASVALEQGFDVAVATRVRDAGDAIRSAGITLFPLHYLRRSSVRPWIEWKAVAELTALYKHWRPSIVHHVAAKPVIYGAIAAHRAGVAGVVSALAGFGFVYASRALRARALRPVLLAAYRFALRHPASRLILQNQDDRAVVEAARLIDPSQIRIIEGAGVDTSQFRPTPEPEAPITVLLAARMLWDKGIGEFVEAARQLRTSGHPIRCVLVGDADNENPAAIPRATIERWQTQGDVEWLRHRTDMPEMMQQCHIVCLPSYREGLPKVLLEAGAAGRAMVATDVPGCREVVSHGVTGLLVPPHDPTALAEAIATLASDSSLRRACAARARELVCARFGANAIHRETLAVYREMLTGVGSAQPALAAGLE